MPERRTGTRQAESNENRQSGAAFRIQNGTLTLFVEDSAVVPLFRNLDVAQNREERASAAGKGPALYRIEMPDMGWIGPNQLDYTALDRRLAALQPDPLSARFILAVNVAAPAWWLTENPTERIQYVRASGQGSAETDHVSWASLRWRQEAGSALERMLRHLLATKAGRCCIGIELQAGGAGAWLMPDADRLPDIGPCMTQAFRAFARDKYRRNEELLRLSWFDTQAEFGKIHCPDVRMRAQAEYGLLRSPHRSRKLLDYYECLGSVQNEAALHFCAIVKRSMKGTALVGLRCAPLDAKTCTPENGFTFPETLLESSDLDFFVADGQDPLLSFARPFSGSLRLREKFLFLQAKEKETASGTAARALGSNAGVIVPAHGEEEDLQAIVGMGMSASKAAGKLRKSPAQVALILDPAAGLYLADQRDAAPVAGALFIEQLKQWGTTGAAYDVYALTDLFHREFPDYKVLVFLNIFYLSEAERRQVDARVKRSGQTAVWFWAAGVVGEKGINAEYGQRCCGQKLRLEPGATSLRTRIVSSGDALTWGRTLGQTFGSELPVSPTCTVTDKAATRLGANTANKTTFSALRYETWTSVVYGTLPVPAELLRNLLKAAGCHLYCESLQEGDHLTVDGRSLTFASRQGGRYSFSLPGRFDVWDVRSRTRVSTDTTEFTITLSRREIASFELRSKRS